MDLELNTVSYEGKWFDFGNARLKIRPFPASRVNLRYKEGAVILAGENTLEKFRYCLQAWEGFVSSGDAKPIELTDEIKRKVFDFRLGSVKIGEQDMTISDFVISKADELFLEMVSAEKNS